MLYIYITNNHIKLLSIKKSLLGQYSVAFSEKSFHADLLKEGRVTNIDVLASAIKEVINTLSAPEKNVFLILPQEAFYFLRTNVSNDINASAITSFLRDKIKTVTNTNLDELNYDYFSIENANQKYINLFAIEDKIIIKYQETFKLLDLEIVTIIPETLAYYKLFDKTLRKEKVENILYGGYEKNHIYTFLYDTFGLLDAVRIDAKIPENRSPETILKQKTAEYEKKNLKINRLILGGTNSENIRQDTFTKEVGIWTNPLKRIIPNFYQDYVKMLTTENNLSFPVLSYDACFGAFIFSLENKNFTLIKKRFVPSTSSASPVKKPFAFPKISKEIILFIASFTASFFVFTLISKTNISLPKAQKSNINKPTVILSPTLIPTPTISIKKELVKIKILNGSGIKGKATDLRDALKEKKYQEVLTGNADNFDYEKSEINIKKGESELKNIILEDIKDYINTPKITELNDKDNSDVIIIIGKDIK